MTDQANLSTKIDKVKQHWGQKAREDLQRQKFVAWMNHPYIEQHYINKQISNNTKENWFTYVNKKYVTQQLELGLNIGCGEGGLERHAFRLGMCKRFEAFDIAEGAVQAARERAAQQGIDPYVEYAVADINKIQLEPGKYDIAFACMSAHHFEELEHVFGEVRNSLKAPGLFILYEFVGPSQFQWTDRQLSIINNLLRILPAKYRENLSFPGQLKEQSRRLSLDEMNNLDPSEAIRSAEIIPLLSEYFNVVERIDYGGTILHMLLQDIVGNFDPEKEEDVTILRLLCYLEETLIKSGVLSSDFSLIVAQKKEPGSEQLTSYPKGQNEQIMYSEQSYEGIINHLSGEDIARRIPIKKIIKAVGFKLAGKPGFRWLYRFRGLGKKVLGG